MSHKTSKADYTYFKKCAVYFQKLLGVTDWKIYFVHEDEDNCLAWIRRDHSGRVCTIGLSVDWTYQPVSRELIKQCARHEILHLLTADIIHIGQQRQTTDDDFAETEHALIRRLENAWN